MLKLLDSCHLPKMARRHHYPVLVFVTLVVTSIFQPVKCSELNQVYALPPASMIQEQQNTSAATLQAVQVKPPEILLRNNLLHKSNASLSPQRQQVQQKTSIKTSPVVTPQNGQHFPANPTSFTVPVNGRAPTIYPSPMSSLTPMPGNNQHQQPSSPNTNINNNFHFSSGPNANFLTSHPSKVNGTTPSFSQQKPALNSFNEVDRFLNFVPMDYENGQMSGFIPPHQKREARPGNRRAGHGPPPPRRNSTLKSLISSFHEKMTRIFLGPRRRGPKPMRLPPAPAGAQSQQPEQNRNNVRFDQPIREEARNLNAALPETPATDRSFTAAMNTVAQILKQNQYIPMLGKRERVRSLSQEESQHLDSLRRRDRKPNRRRYPRRRFPSRKRRPHPRDRPPPYEDDAPEKHEQPFHDEEEYHGKSKFNRFPKSFDDLPPHRDHGPPYKGFKSFKAFKPWKPSFESHEDHEDHQDQYNYKNRKPAWYIPDSDEKESNRNPSPYQSHYYGRTHHHDKYKEYSPESYHNSNNGIEDSEGFKPIKPFYGGGGFGAAKFKDWDEKKMKFHKVIEYDHGVVDFDPFPSKMKQGASIPAPVKEEDARIPKIIINHHHNLPPAPTGANFIPNGFPANSVLSYTPPIHYHDDFFRGGRGGRNKMKDYKSNEFADSFIVNDYGKPPIPSFGMPPPNFGVRPHMPHGGPPPGIAASPPMGGHMVFDHFAQNMPPHFMHGKAPPPPHPHMNHPVPFGPPPAGHPVSYSHMNFPKPMMSGPPGGHFPQHSPGFPSFRQHPDSHMDPYGKPFATQMASYNEMPEHFPHSPPPGYNHHEGGGFGPHHSQGHPPPDSSPFPSTNQHHDNRGFIPPFTPVPTKEDDIPPTQGPITPASRETFFQLSPKRKKVPRKFEFKIVKTLSSGFDIPEKLTNHPLAEPKPTPMMNYFDLGVPDREHYKKKQRKNPNNSNNNNNNNNSPNSREDQQQYHHEKHYSPPSLNQHKFESSEFNYSTLPDNWRNFRPDPSHNKLPSLTHDSTEGGSSRMYKIRTALNPKSLMKAIIDRFPRARVVDKTSRAHTKFTPFDAVAKSREDMHSSNRKRRKSTKTPASIQDIIDSDSSNHNKEIVVPLSDDELNNNSDHEGGASSPSATVIVVGKGRAKKPKKSRRVVGGGAEHVSNEMQTEMPFNSGVDNDVLLGRHSQQTIDIPLAAEIRMGEEADVKKKK